MTIAEERWVLGSALLRSDRLPDEALALDPHDFVGADHPRLWAAILDSIATNDHIDCATMTTKLRNGGLARSDLTEWLTAMTSDAPSATGQPGHARTIRTEAVARRLRLELADTLDGIGPLNIEETAERLTKTAAKFLAEAQPVGALPSGLIPYEDLDPGDEDTRPWIIPGVLRAGWRYIITSGEGVGKSLLLRQFALCAHNGVNPLTFRSMRPARTLTIDLENPDEVIAHQRDLVWRRLQHEKGTTLKVPVFRRGAGMDIRDPRQYRELEAVITHTAPQLIVLGPLYKLFTAKKDEPWDQVALDVAQRIDALRVRHGFAIMIEHHAPSQTGTGHRDLAPFGSSVWRRWPEFGHALRRDGDQGRFKVEEWRGDRVHASWPDAYDKGNDNSWPWVPYWNTKPMGAAA